MTRPIAMAAVMLAASVLIGCRDNEQGRPLSFDKGHYAGTPLARPSAEAIAALRGRVQMQRF